MAQVTLKGNPVRIAGDLPAVGDQAPAFTLTAADLSEKGRGDFPGRRLVLNIFPSVDTPTCATSVRRFNQEAAALPETEVLCVSVDLPFAQQRFCGVEGLEHVLPLSAFRHPEFGRDYGVTIEDGPMAGLLARAVVVLDAEGRVLHRELVGEIAQEPDYDAALAALRG